MAIEIGTIVGAPLVTGDTNNGFGTHYNKLGIGGWKSVATLMDRDLISLERRELGNEVKVLEDGKTYELVGGLDNGSWVEIIQGGGATGATGPMGPAGPSGASASIANFVPYNGALYDVNLPTKLIIGGYTSSVPSSLNIKGRLQLINNASSLYIGVDSGRFETTGTFNIGIGYTSLFKNASGRRHTAIGEETLYNNKSGYDCIAIGYRSQVGDTNYGFGNNSQNNISLGNYALYSVGNGKRNIGIGHNSGYTNVVGDNNVSIGDNTMYANILGENNVVIGSGAVRQATAVFRSVVIGQGAVATSGGANDCVAIGYMSSYKSNAFRSVIIGYQASYNATEGNSNLVIKTGIGSFDTGILTGTDNTLLGRVSGLNATASNVVIIADGIGNRTIEKLENEALKSPIQTNTLIDNDLTGKALITKEYLNNNVDAVKVKYVELLTGTYDIDMTWDNSTIVIMGNCTLNFISDSLPKLSFNFITEVGANVTFTKTTPKIWAFGTPNIVSEKSYGNITINSDGQKIYIGV